MSSLVALATDTAREYHEGQEHFFGPGSYYDVHLEPVARIVERLGYGERFIATALLHDILEDTQATPSILSGRGFDVGIVEAVLNLTEQDGEPQEDYLGRIATSPLSVVVKYADSSFNYAWTILNSPRLPDENFRDWGLEYAKNIAFLRPILPEIA